MIIKREIVAEYLRFRIIFSACKLRITKFLEKKRRGGGGKAVRGGGDNPTENLIKSGPQKNWFHRGGGSNETPLVILGGHLIRSLSTDLTAFLLLGWSRSWGPMALIPSRSPPPSSLAPFLSWMRALLQYSTLIKRYDSNSLLSEHVASPRSALEQILLEFRTNLWPCCWLERFFCPVNQPCSTLFIITSSLITRLH